MADDPFADYQNMMGMQGLFGQNPYLEYQGKIPMAGYYGTPTNAQGQPIQSYLDAQKAHDAWAAANPTPPQGTTLNTPPLVGSQTFQDLGYDSGAPQYARQGGGGGTITRPVYDASGSSSIGQHNTLAGMGLNVGPLYGGSQGQQQPAAVQQNPIDMRQAYLNALSNPGPVTTPGAQIYPGAAQTGAPQPSVLNQFLAAHAGGGTTGAGGYTNVPFFNTLNALKAGGTR